MSNNIIQKFNSSGTYLSKLGSNFSSADGRFRFPHDVAIDSQDNVYVADSANSRIQKFSSNGTFLTKFGSPGSGDGQFDMLYSIAIDSHDNIYVGDYNGVQKFAYSDSAILAAAPETGSNVPGVVTLITPPGSTITCSSTASEIVQASQDVDYVYPLGLVDFCFTSSQVTNLVTIIFQTNLKPNQVTPRKYDPNSKTYTNLPASANAIITETTLSGSPALKLTYTITDNGELDNDPILGSIKDPIGLGVIAGVDGGSDLVGVDGASADSLAETGMDLYLVEAISVLSIVFGLTGARYMLHRSKL